jgi:hypothetical protein
MKEILEELNNVDLIKNNNLDDIYDLKNRILDIDNHFEKVSDLNKKEIIFIKEKFNKFSDNLSLIEEQNNLDKNDVIYTTK